MHLYNTLSGKKEIIKKTRKPLRLFVCGPTVYDTPHIGNYRTFLAFDALVRYMRSRGYPITYLQNITDVDDKIIRRAQEKKVTWKSLARTYERMYHQGEKQFNISSVSAYARATDYIPEIITQVQTLIKKGHAYLISHDGYYFDITTFADYGKLSHRTAVAAEDATSRIDESVYKRNKGDFVLWKLSKPGEPSWKTPLGNGRPGWHIEDTAITQKHFGPQYDLHGGAGELKFPHHEAEIAQQEAASGKKPFVKVWVHTGILLINGEKMSKSLHNFVGVDDFLKQFDARVFRYLVLSNHYRTPIDYSTEVANQAARALENIQRFIWKIKAIQQNTQKRKGEKNGVKKNVAQKLIKQIEKDFYAALDDDFNTPAAFGVVFSGITSLETQLSSVSSAQANNIQKQLIYLFESLGISFTPQVKIPASILRLSAQREKFRVYKQFMQADTLRDKIHALGYSVEDTPRGATVMPKDIFIKISKHQAPNHK